MTDPGADGLALVMSGGGARAAYQVGLLRFVAEHVPQLRLPVLTGVSAGAINAALLAGKPQDFAGCVEHLTRLWSHLTTDEVFDVQGLSLARSVLRAGLKLISGGSLQAPPFRALVDTRPLRELLQRELGDEQGRLRSVQSAIDAGRLHAVAITASSYTTGRSMTWIQGRDCAHWERAHRLSQCCELTVDHVLASSALPVLFPAVRVGAQWYGDGGVRLTAPLSPAIHLGATRILAISTRYRRSLAEAAEPVIEGYPPPAQMAGLLLNAVFLDQLDADALSVERVNCLIQRLPSAACGQLRPVRLLVLRPSRDLGRLANEYEAQLPRAFRFLTRGLGTRETRSNDLLSLMMFQPDYIARLIELGEADARARGDEILAFLEG